jgi:hypothetical protein
MKDGEKEIQDLDQQTVELKEKKNMVRLMLYVSTLHTESEESFSYVNVFLCIPILFAICTSTLSKLCINLYRGM